MISTTDIYLTIDSSIVRQNFWKKDIEGKKKLIDTELKKYIIIKLQELNIVKSTSIKNIENLSVNELLQVLANAIPQKQHDNILRHFIHYIIQVAGSLQNWSITWWVEDDEKLIESPLIESDEYGLWNSIKTNAKTDYVKVFDSVYGFFNNGFTAENVSKTLTKRFGKE